MSRERRETVAIAVTWVVTTVGCALVHRYVGAWQAGALFVLLVLVLMALFVCYMVRLDP